ncbi:DUF429 domain-containing protein [Pseudorhodoferax sp.]|uniref:DUF429 domain-containing protein n=1 Tax=Pseudorhodoferax sp. TaxID=1993553 RepID=UPI0039E43183
MLEPLNPALLGCDFSSSPGRRKPIVLALGALDGRAVRLHGFVRCDTLAAFADWLAAPRDWVGGFDLPFGLPRTLVQALGWPTDWQACMRHYAGLTRAEIRACFVAWCAARPAGAKFAHRAVDRPAGASPSMKWVNPPVAFMLHAGVPLLLQAGVHLPGLMPPPPPGAAARRVGLEAYPGLLARALIGRRSYKSDDRARQTPERQQARRALVDALRSGAGASSLGLSLDCTADQALELVADASGDRLDAALCLLQAGWALARHRDGAPLYGLPPQLDPLEGWIVTVPWPSIGG